MGICFPVIILVANTFTDNQAMVLANAFTDNKIIVASLSLDIDWKKIRAPLYS